ncbi:hypothetical protein B0H13DRAFT_1896332 [Mycena leptocephala]|nr:hypothetical protein B0H13DRAFT_1896332 [Mycena leptocephala]
MVEKTGDKLLELLDPGNDNPPALEPVSDDDVPDLIPDPFDYGKILLDCLHNYDSERSRAHVRQICWEEEALLLRERIRRHRQFESQIANLHQGERLGPDFVISGFLYSNGESVEFHWTSFLPHNEPKTRLLYVDTHILRRQMSFFRRYGQHEKDHGASAALRHHAGHVQIIVHESFLVGIFGCVRVFKIANFALFHYSQDIDPDSPNWDNHIRASAAHPENKVARSQGGAMVIHFPFTIGTLRRGNHRGYPQFLKLKQNRFKWIVPIGGIRGWQETGGTIYDCRLEFKAE